ncbi:MAG: DUF4430 domain-containing protein, partial [Lachnospiraceae bacterium]|nr:DUF4430 domain-containing protein [Lachnospiraceae bacterium]
MQMKRSKKLLSFILCIALTVAMALFTTGCNGSTNPSSGAGTEVNTQIEDNSQAGDNSHPEYQQLGEGSTKFTFTVVDGEGEETLFEIRTDKETVGEALLELELIAGDESEYGLYVKTVNGITVDYDKDGKYWAFYVDDEYAQAGV